MTTFLMGCQGVWPVNASGAESPNTTFDTSDVERSTDVNMNEGRMADTANEDGEPGTTIGASCDLSFLWNTKAKSPS